MDVVNAEQVLIHVYLICSTLLTHPLSRPVLPKKLELAPSWLSSASQLIFAQRVVLREW